MPVTFNGVPGFATPGAFVPGRPLIVTPSGVKAGTPPTIPTSGGDRGFTIRVFREIRPGDVPSSGAQLPRLTGRAFLVPVPVDEDHATHAWEAPEPAPGQIEQLASEISAALQHMEAAAGRAVELGRIFADPPYQRQPKRCGAIRKVGGAMLTCGRRPGHGGKHSDRGLDWR